jgi:DNA-binding response OmpR family regulator
MHRVNRSTRPARKLRSTGSTTSKKRASTVIIGPLIIDKQLGIVQIERRNLHLTPKELALLSTLATAPGRIFRREELLREVWREVSVAARTVDVHMSKLRKKLRASDSGFSLAETVWGMGYRLQYPSS